MLMGIIVKYILKLCCLNNMNYLSQMHFSNYFLLFIRFRIAGRLEPLRVRGREHSGQVTSLLLG